MNAVEFKAWRKARGLSRSKGAAALGIALSTLGKYEDPKREQPIPRPIVKLIQLLDIQANSPQTPTTPAA
jgi:transcriptional regulator with XRE-family HTH domain